MSNAMNENILNYAKTYNFSFFDLMLETFDAIV